MAVRSNKISSKERLSRLQAEAKKVLAVRGTVQFRLDEGSMLRLMKAADDRKMPVGTLVRMWMVERLRTEGYC